jgi:hypothetical protein
LSAGCCCRRAQAPLLPPRAAARLPPRPVLHGERVGVRGNPRAVPLLPRPALRGERVGVRGSPRAVALLPRPALRGERVGVRGDPRVVRAANQKSTNPTSTKCTARNPYPTAPAARLSANPRPTTWMRAAEAKSFSQPTRANPAQSSAPPPAPAVARRGIAVGGRSGRFSVSG